MAEPKKPQSDQPVTRRAPRQERSRQKVELMLEAATRLLQQDDPANVSTNAIAKLAGISIGTLYQYFPDKDSLFQALAERELQELSDRIVAVMTGPAPERPGGRISAVVGAVLDAYGGRGIAHRRLMQYSMARGSAGVLGPMLRQLQASFVQRGIATPQGGLQAMSPADAFVMTHAVNGVMRAAVMADPADYGSREALEQSLTRLILASLTPAADRSPTR